MNRLLLVVSLVTFLPSVGFGQERLPEGPWKSHEAVLSAMKRPERTMVPPSYVNPTKFRIYRVNQDTGQAPQNEPSVRINPTNPNNIVAAFRDFRLGWQPAIRNVTIAATTDGGKTWVEQFAQYLDHNRFSDPSVGVDTEGNFYVATLDYKDLYEGGIVSVRLSTNGGLGWWPAVPVGPDSLNYDKDMMCVDDCATSPYCGNVYVAWDGLIPFARSTYLGMSFSFPLDTPAWAAPAPATGPSGELYVVSAPAMVVKSTDGGLTFGPNVRADDTIHPAVAWGMVTHDGVFSLSEPVLAVDKGNGSRRGTAYVVYLSTALGDGDLFCVKSTDGGSSWGPSVRVNNDSLRNGRDQFHFWMTVDDSGFVDVVFLDRRNDPANILCDAYFAQSRDGGVSFKNFRLTSENFDPRITPNADVRLGEYIGIDARKSRIVPCWVDTHLGNQDIFIAVIDQEKTATIAGIVQKDCGGGLPNWPVLLAHDNGIDTAYTDSLGRYAFQGLYPGSYIVNEESLPGWQQISPVAPEFYAVAVDSYEVAKGRDFLNQQIPWTSWVQGWGMISLPVKVPDPRVSTLFPNAQSSLYGYSNSYDVEDTMEIGRGYWLKFCNEPYPQLTGESIATDTIEVRAGWNMIGALSTPLGVSAIVSVPPDNMNSQIFSYVDESYTPSDSLRPARGYWVRCKEGGSLIFSSTMIAPAFHAMRQHTPDMLNRLTIEDHLHHQQSLFFGESGDYGETDLSWYDLPPKPPEGGFDVRFSSQRTVEVFPLLTLSELQYPIELQTNSENVTLRWDVRNDGMAYELSWGMNGAVSRTIVLEGRGSRSLRVHAGVGMVLGVRSQKDLPASYLLSQNYPNPFNPATLLRYQLPVESRVRLTIQDLLGQEVAVLVNGIQGAGYRQTEWNAAHFASGIYFYRIEAVSIADPGKTFNQVRKMVLVK